MTLQEAIEQLMEYTGGDSFPKGLLFPSIGSECDREAIATILNAVVKGELVSRVTAMHTISLIGRHGHWLDDDVMNILEGNSVKGDLK